MQSQQQSQQSQPQSQPSQQQSQQLQQLANSQNPQGDNQSQQKRQQLQQNAPSEQANKKFLEQLEINKQWLKETEHINYFIQNELIYLRKDMEKCQILCCENLVKIMQQLNRYKEIFQERSQNYMEIFKQTKHMQEILLKTQQNMLNHHYAGHIALLYKYNQHYFKIFQDIDNEQQNMIGQLLNNSHRPNLYINRENQGIPISDFAYVQIFNYLKSKNYIKSQDLFKKLLIPQTQTKSVLQDINPQLSKRAVEILNQKDQEADQFLMNKKVKLDVVRSYKELSFWRKLAKSVGQKGQQQIFKQSWDYHINELQSNALIDADEKSYEQKNNIPAIKAKDYINLVQNFLDRKILSETKRPNIINVKLDDFNQEVTTIKLSQRGSLLLAGTKSGAILQFNLIQVQPQESADSKNLQPKQQQQSMFQHPEIDQNQKLEPDTSFSFIHKFIGHTGSITAFSILYDEQYFLSASVDNLIRLWCIKSKQCLLTFKLHIKTIWDLQFAQSGYFFLSASADKTAVLWTTDKLSPQYIFSGHQSDVVFAKFSPNSQYVYTGSLDFKIRIFRGVTDEEFSKDDNEKYAECLKTFVIDFHITSSCLSFDGGFLALGGLYGEFQVLDLMKQAFYEKIYFQKPEERCQISDITISMDQQEIAVTSLTTCVIYNLNQVFNTGCIKIYDQYYTDKQKYEEDKQKNRFGQKLPLDIFEIDQKRPEVFFTLQYHPKNFIILVSK